MVDIVLTLITRRDCHLCEDMATVVDQVVTEMPARLEVRDVDGDPDLQNRYGEEVPVLLINGRKAFKYRVLVRDLRRRLRAEQRRKRLAGWRDYLFRLREE